MGRIDPPKTNQIYHVYNRSIAQFRIFRYDNDYERMVLTLDHYRETKPFYSLSHKLDMKDFQKMSNLKPHENGQNPEEYQVDILGFCLLPNHFHLILAQTAEQGIVRFMANVQNSYTRYFNEKYDRRGPLWESRYKNKWTDSPLGLMTLLRYVHLNPVKANLVSKPSDWTFSSHCEFTKDPTHTYRICQNDRYFHITERQYLDFMKEEKWDPSMANQIGQLPNFRGSGMASVD